MATKFSWTTLIVAVSGIVCSVGCAKGPLRGLRFLNPQAQQLLAEEEKIAKSWETIRSEMEGQVDVALKGSERQQQILAERLGKRVTSENPTIIRIHAVELLGKLPNQQAVAALASVADDAEVDVRTAACRSLGEIGNRDALQQLREVIATDENEDVQIAATRAVGRFPGNPDVYTTLKEALASNRPAIQVSAAEALKRTTGQDFGLDIPKWEQYLASSRGRAVPANASKPKASTFGEAFNNTFKQVGFFREN